jgi:hypothetical protein
MLLLPSLPKLWKKTSWTLARKASLFLVRLDVFCVGIELRNEFMDGPVFRLRAVSLAIF